MSSPRWGMQRYFTLLTSCHMKPLSSTQSPPPTVPLLPTPKPLSPAVSLAYQAQLGKTLSPVAPLSISRSLTPCRSCCPP